MSRTTRVLKCTPEDGWSYGLQVVGAAAWPAPGSRIHHSVGAWPILLGDTAEVEQVEAPVMLRLRRERDAARPQRRGAPPTALPGRAPRPLLSLTQ